MSKSYVPPHMRAKVGKNEKVGKVQKVEKPPTDISNFPELVVSKPVEESKMDFS